MERWTTAYEEVEKLDKDAFAVKKNPSYSVPACLELNKSACWQVATFNLFACINYIEVAYLQQVHVVDFNLEKWHTCMHTYI